MAAHHACEANICHGGRVGKGEGGATVGSLDGNAKAYKGVTIYLHNFMYVTPRNFAPPPPATTARSLRAALSASLHSALCRLPTTHEDISLLIYGAREKYFLIQTRWNERACGNKGDRELSEKTCLLDGAPAPKREIPEKTRRSATSSDTIPGSEPPGRILYPVRLGGRRAVKPPSHRGSSNQTPGHSEKMPARYAVRLKPGKAGRVGDLPRPQTSRFLLVHESLFGPQPRSGLSLVARQHRELRPFSGTHLPCRAVPCRAVPSPSWTASPSSSSLSLLVANARPGWHLLCVARSDVGDNMRRTDLLRAVHMRKTLACGFITMDVYTFFAFETYTKFPLVSEASSPSRHKVALELHAYACGAVVPEYTIQIYMPLCYAKQEGEDERRHKYCDAKIRQCDKALRATKKARKGLVPCEVRVVLGKAQVAEIMRTLANAPCLWPAGLSKLCGEGMLSERGTHRSHQTDIQDSKILQNQIFCWPYSQRRCSSDSPSCVVCDSGHPCAMKSRPSVGSGVPCSNPGPGLLVRGLWWTLLWCEGFSRYSLHSASAAPPSHLHVWTERQVQSRRQSTLTPPECRTECHGGALWHLDVCLLLPLTYNTSIQMSVPCRLPMRYFIALSRGRGGVAVRLFASHLSEPSRSWISEYGNRAGRYRWSAGFLGDLPFLSLLHFGTATYSPRFTLIGSQDLDGFTQGDVLATVRGRPGEVGNRPETLQCDVQSGSGRELRRNVRVVGTGAPRGNRLATLPARGVIPPAVQPEGSPRANTAWLHFQNEDNRLRNFNWRGRGRGCVLKKHLCQLHVEGQARRHTTKTINIAGLFCCSVVALRTEDPGMPPDGVGSIPPPPPTIMIYFDLEFLAAVLEADSVWTLAHQDALETWPHKCALSSSRQQIHSYRECAKRTKSIQAGDVYLQTPCHGFRKPLKEALVHRLCFSVDLSQNSQEAEPDEGSDSCRESVETANNYNNCFSKWRRMYRKGARVAIRTACMALLPGTGTREYVGKLAGELEQSLDVTYSGRKQNESASISSAGLSTAMNGMRAVGIVTSRLVATARLGRRRAQLCNNGEAQRPGQGPPWKMARRRSARELLKGGGREGEPTREPPTCASAAACCPSWRLLDCQGLPLPPTFSLHIRRTWASMKSDVTPASAGTPSTFFCTSQSWTALEVLTADSHMRKFRVAWPGIEPVSETREYNTNTDKSITPRAPVVCTCKTVILYHIFSSCGTLPASSSREHLVMLSHVTNSPVWKSRKGGDCET
ncbi:hypothetical protein PR048_021025 [Dryococelus australis]|uniref:Uncharacterized protein n=1 Tax=Dryococelus australis TaxID=614101 RepID=A0ABQ9GX29_9NEOP|nr:hypothetical protein PR048_021025 [Dryococelus australis]